MSPFFFDLSEEIIHQPKNEHFNPSLTHIDDIDKAYEYVDSAYNSYNIAELDTQKYTEIASKFIKQRFYHGLSSYTIGENWIAYFLGKFTWSHFSAIVKPNDILKRPYGLCSQQTLVFIQILRNKGIKTRTVGLGYPQGPGHFLCEISDKNSWHLYDVTIEPNWERIKNHHMDLEFYLHNRDSIYLVYENKLNKECLNTLFERVNYGNVNEIPAKKMRFFHQTTYLLTFVIPILLLTLIAKVVYISNKKGNL